jgi:FkbM family methyltransferase
VSILPEFFASHLQKDKLKCVDVGARGGLQGSWARFKEFIETDCLEPDPVACERERTAARAGEHWFPIGLAKSSGKHPLYVLGKPSGSSLFPPNPPVISQFSTADYCRLDKVVDIDALSFSDFITRFKRPLPNLIKLDTQGSELDILQSLQNDHWADLIAIQTEIEFIDMYAGQPLFADVDAFMKSKGFILFDLLPVRSYRTAENRTHHYLIKHLGISRNRPDLSCRLIAGDAFYLRPLPEIIASRNPTTFCKMLLTLLIYRCLDEALWLAEEGQKVGLITAQQTAAFVDSVRSIAPRPSLRQRADAIGKFARKLSKMTGIGRARKIEYWLDRSWDH